MRSDNEKIIDSERGKMRFSIICPCYLGEYSTAARQRPAKLVRALRSCMAQTFHHSQFEVILIADGCEQTMEISQQISHEFANPNVNESIDFTCIQILKQPMFSGRVRNRGIADAKGEWIIYLDSDDYFGSNHLKIVNDEIDRLCRTKTISHDRTLIGKDSAAGPDWVCFNDYVFKKQKWQEREIKIDSPGQHGTSNVAHKRSLNLYWNSQGYAKDDTYFIRSLRNFFPNFKKIKTPEYMVCHVPGLYDK